MKQWKIVIIDGQGGRLGRMLTVNMCGARVVGVKPATFTELAADAVEELRRLIGDE